MQDINGHSGLWHDPLTGSSTSNAGGNSPTGSHRLLSAFAADERHLEGELAGRCGHHV